ncbi:MAG: leucine-rich repeat protein [Clostridia bacterium]|nr:leucine-rich repeat protein [Clostridia bacterium]
MKYKTKKIALAVTSLSMAALLGASYAIQMPVTNLQNGGLNTPTADTAKNITKLSDEFTSSLDNTQFFKDSITQLNTLAQNSDGTRRIIVEFESKSQIDVYLGNTALQSKYLEFADYANGREGVAYAKTLEKEQDAFFKALNKTSLEYEARHAYTSILNAVSLVVHTKDVAKIEGMDGVKNVILSEVYLEPTVEPTINVVDVYGTGIYDSSDISYKGDGMLVSVLDTGFDIAHNAFQTMPQVEKVDLEDVKDVFPRLAANGYGGNSKTTANDVYYNAKVPFAYDYADKDADVFAIANSHGVHVAGIIAGQDDSVTEEDDKAFKNGEKFIGVAPNAQLMIGKVFSDKDTARGADTDDILAAVSDSVLVGADVINMSLGMSCGFSREEDGDVTNEIYEKVYAAGVNLVVAAGNEASSAMGGAYGSTNLTSNPDSATVGSPSTYFSSLSVASISGQKASYMLLDDGTAVYFNESSSASGQQGKFVEELLNGQKTRELSYVVVPGYGRPGNYTNAVKNALKQGDCVAVVSRGDISFEEKQKNAFDAGAVACIIYNNMSGKISASLGTGKKIPTCTVAASIGQKFVQNGSGKITLNEEYKAGPFMSDFSSWGPTNDLKIKPEITAHGGEITSAVVGGYAQYSGTSMAAPNMAGAVALLRQHVSETYGLTGVELANRVNQLLMSTATIVYDENGLPYAVRKQGAGLGDIGKAISTDAYLYVENSPKTKLELGDDENRTGVYKMDFHVTNTSTSTKTYKLDLVAMTESVSIDNITVEEKAYLLNDAQKTYLVNGENAKSVTLEPGADAKITVTLALSAEEKAYLEENFANGMYVEGFVTLKDQDSNGVDLSIPYLAFYGNWEDAPMFDKSAYEVSKDHYDTSIKDEDKIVAAIYESIAIGHAYKDYKEYYLPLGQYLYRTPNDADSGVVSSVDKISIGNSQYGVYGLYAMYMGMLRPAAEMDIRIENAVTGEVIFDKTEYNVRKSHNTGPSVVEFELTSEELGLMNNEQYKVIMTAYNDYDNEEDFETREFGFYVDYQAPLIQSSKFRYEDNADGTRKVFLDLEIYDNHYSQSIQLFIPLSETEADFITTYPVPIKDGVRDGISKVSINVTDYVENMKNAPGEYKNTLGVRVDDYALNASAYLVQLHTTLVDEIKFSYTYKDENRQEVTKDFDANTTVVLRPNESLDLTKGSGYVLNGDTTQQVTFSVEMLGYTGYICSHPDEHGVACNFAFDEVAGYTYKKGDYYYDKASGTVMQKTEDDTEATYAPYTKFFSVIAEEVVKTGKNNYVQPESKHFVCPACGTEEVFAFNKRTGKFTTNTFKAFHQDPMIFDVIFTSANPNVVKVQDGSLYAVGEGTTTITARPSNNEDAKNDVTFTVKVEGKAVNSFIEEITVGSLYNKTKKETRNVSTGGASVECGSELVLYPSFTPWYVTEINDLVWRSSDPDTVEILTSSSSSATVLCKKPGSASILISSPSNSLIGTFLLVVEEQYIMNSYYFYDYKGVGYSEKYVDEKGATRNMLVIPANLGIVMMGSWTTSFGYEGTFEDVKGLDTVVVPQGVTSIGANCFQGTSIRRIYLPSSIEQISSYAFDGTPLEEVFWYDAGEDSKSGIEYDADKNTYDWDVFYANATVESTAKRIVLSYGAFDGCKNLKTFDFSRVTAAFSSAMYGCKSLKSVDASNLRYAESYIFGGCSSLDSVTLHKDTVLGSNAFMGTGLTEVDYYGSVVAKGLFSNATNLTKITFHNDVTLIGENAFSGCSKLSTVEFKGACQEISNKAFANCTSLTTFAMPEGMKTIGNEAFSGCSKLASVTVDAQSDIQTVGNNVFKNCANLKSVTVDGQASHYNTATSGSYTMLTNANGTRIILAPTAYPLTYTGVFTVPSNMTEIGEYAYANNSSLEGKELIIPEGVEKIGYAAFSNVKIKKVVIPASVTEISAYAFAGCTNLETVVFLCDLKEIAPYTFQGCSSLTNVQIPASVEVIGERAFKGTDIRKVDLGENLKEIGTEAFYQCEALAQINFAEQSVLDTIGEAAFGGCRSVKNVVMPDTVRVLGAYAFVGCYSLESVYVSSALEEMGDYAFSANGMLTTVTFGSGAKEIGDYAFFTPVDEGNLSKGFYYNTSLKTVVIPESIERIGQFAFAGNTVITTMRLNGVKEIGDYAFHYATALHTVNVTSVLERIGKNAFIGSSIRIMELKDVKYIDDQAFLGTDIGYGKSSLALTNVVEIGMGAFYNCMNLPYSIDMPVVVKIGDMAFYTQSASKINSVNLGTKLTTLGGAVFVNSSITTITLPASLKEIGTPAFAACMNLREIKVNSKNKVFFVENNGLYRILENETYELVAVPNALSNNGRKTTDPLFEDYTKIDEDYKNLTPYKIKENTTRIAVWAMGHCQLIHAVEIPASVQTIGAYAFWNLGYQVLVANQALAQTSRAPYAKFIFKGLQAPALEGEYTEESTALDQMYVNFVYNMGYLMSDMIIPVNAKGFESLLYTYCFYEKVYSEELIESDTKKLRDWLTTLDVDALTADDKAVVTEMNMIYFMMRQSQKAFISEELQAKLVAAVDKLANVQV